MKIGDVLTKNGRTYEYRGDKRLNGADGFLLCDLDEPLQIAGTAPHWAPDWAFSSFEVVPPVPRRERPKVIPRPIVDVHLHCEPTS